MSVLFLASMCFLLIPELLKATIFCMVGHSLPVIVTMLVDVLGIVGGFILLILYIRKKQRWETPGILVCLEGLMPALCAYMLSWLMMEFVYPLMALVFYKSVMTGIILYAAVTLMLFIMQGMAFYAFVIRCSGRKGTFGSYMRRIYLGVPASILVGLLSLVGELVYFKLPFNNVTVHFLMYLAASLLMAGLFWLAFALLCRMADKAERAPSIGLEFRAYNTFFTVGALILLGFSVFRSLYHEPVREITKTLDAYVYEAEMDMATADLDGAVEKMDRMQKTLAIWKQCAGIGEEGTLEDAVYQSPTDEEWMYLAAYYYQDASGIAQYMRMYDEHPELSLAVLDLYRKPESYDDLSAMKMQKECRQAALVNCLENGYYTSTWLRPEDVEGKALKLAGEIPEYTKYEKMYNVMHLLLKDYQGGAATQELVDEALLLAEQYPDDWMVQYTAAKAGSELTYDGAGHYEATGNAALRYVELYIGEKDPSAEEAYDLRLSAAQMMLQCYQYETALKCLNAALDMDESGNAYIMMAQCYNELNMLEECYQTSAEYLKTHPESSTAMYYGAVSALKLGMHDEMLQMTSKLAAALEDCEDPEERLYLDFSLYNLLQYISLNDEAQWTGYQYAFYDQITEEQWPVIEENAFFAKYLKAVYNAFKADTAVALELVEELLAEHEDIANLWYLKGVILYNMQDVTRFEEAVECYRKALSIMPEYATAWYAMANAYDGLEEYELAIEACEHALALLPEQDHGEDWYGISIHCGRLLEALKSKVG